MNPVMEAPAAAPQAIRRVIRATVGGFPQYRQTVQSLPPPEQQNIERLAALIVQSYARGARPIHQVSLIGHADRDARRGRAFEDQISRERASQVQRALAYAVTRRGGAIATHIRWQVEAAGASQPLVRAPTSELERARNRRVDIFLTNAPVYARRGSLLIRASGAALEATTLPSPRPCCLLAPSVSPSPFSSTDNFAEPGKLGTHRAADEVSGLIYSGKAGFVDLGHLRDLIDTTKFVCDQIIAAAGKPTTIRTMHGEARILTTVPSTDWRQLAMDICYDDSFAYEILTYTAMYPGGHNSSFSPEDLPSNYMGTATAIEAVKAGGNFNAAATAKIDSLIKDLNGQTIAETLKSFNRINNRWVSYSGFNSILNDRYLKRRNFNLLPWQTGHASDTARPSWYGSGMGSTAKSYSYTHTAGRSIPKADWPKELATIRADAASVYGSDYDKP